MDKTRTAKITSRITTWILRILMLLVVLFFIAIIATATLGGTGLKPPKGTRHPAQTTAEAVVAQTPRGPGQRPEERSPLPMTWLRAFLVLPGPFSRRLVGRLHPSGHA